MYIGSGMDLSEIARDLGQLWDEKPGTMVLLVVGGVGSLFLFIDTWRHRRHRKRPR